MGARANLLMKDAFKQIPDVSVIFSRAAERGIKDVRIRRANQYDPTKSYPQKQDGAFWTGNTFEVWHTATDVRTLIDYAYKHYEESSKQHSWMRIIVEAEMRDIGYSLKVSEGEPIVFEITSQPENGIIVLDMASGATRLALIKKFFELGEQLHAEGFTDNLPKKYKWLI